MLEQDMESLLHKHPDAFFNEPLTPFSRQQPCTTGGRIDLVFSDRNHQFLIAEVKRGCATRSAVGQLAEYRVEITGLHPGKAARLMVIAEEIPAVYREAVKGLGIECLEIPEERFRAVALERGTSLSVDLAASKGRTISVSPRDSANRPPRVDGAKPPTPDRQMRRNPFKPGFYCEVFEVARNEGISVPETRRLAIAEGAFDVNQRVQSTITNLMKGVRRRGGERDGHRGLLWDVAIDGIAAPINGAGPDPSSMSTIRITNVRRLDGQPFTETPTDRGRTWGAQT